MTLNLPRPPSPSRDALISAGIRLFGANGFDATSVRRIADAAGGQNVAVISYYFGSKEGLRIACAEAIIARMEALVPVADAKHPLESSAAVARLEAALDRVIQFMVDTPEAQDIAAFLIREASEAGAAFELIYTRMIAPRHTELCRLWGLATGQEPETPEVKLAVFALIGQLVYFRIGRYPVMRRMAWEEVGPAELEQIRQTLRRSLHANLAAHSGG